jgi:hypothetical protein
MLDKLGIPTKNPQEVLVSDTKKIPCLACKLHSTRDNGTRDISSTPSGDPENIMKTIKFSEISHLLFHPLSPLAMVSAK